MKCTTTRSRLPQNALRSLRASVKKAHPDTTTTVKVLQRHGWSPAPQLIDIWCATVEISGEGYRPKRATLTVLADGRWRCA